MAQIDLEKKFPRMTPIASPPKMFRVNGCGTGVYGSRDVDPETGAYVTTYCLSLLYVPVLALRAYRVARARQGWYFLGREPLSPLAKGLNAALLSAVLLGSGVWGWVAYTGTAEYKAERQMAEARRLVAGGQLAKGAEIYRKLSVAGAEQSHEATDGMKHLVEVEGQQAPLDEAAGVFAAAAQVARRGEGLPASEVLEKGMQAAAARGDWEPRGGIAVLDAVRPLTVDTRAVDERRMALLKKWAAGEPTNLDVITPLAGLYAQRNQLDEAKKILMPVRDRLGDGEGARVLGTVLAREHDYDGAYALLWPYVKGRLDKLHAAEKESENVVQRLWEREIGLLKSDKGPQDFYRKLENAAAGERQGMVREYVNARIKNDGEFAAAQQELERATSVVPVALELGMVMLERAQHQADPAARKSQLEAAEQVFLAIGGVAGEADEYRMSLGEVYYWLGKQADGKKQFDDLLAAKGRNFTALLGVGARLRELGAEPEARALAEEAYGKASKEEERQEAAEFRALCAKDSDYDDEINWLGKGSTTDPQVKARLASARGHKAYAEGHDAEAAAQYRASIDAYAAMPRSATTLNQTALAYYDIFEVSGDHQALERCVDNFQQAVDLSPSDPILLYNAGVTLQAAALAEVIGGEIDLRALHESGRVSLLRYLYRDQAGRDAVVARLRAHPGIARSMSYLQKAIVLAPKNPRPYEAVYEIQQFVHDDAAVADLERRMKEAGLDTADRVAAMKEFVAGAKDEQQRGALVAQLKRLEDLAGSARAKGGRTAAVVLCTQAEGMMKLDEFTGTVDPDKVVALAEEADRVAPSSATSGAVESAYVFRAQRRLMRADPAYRAFATRYARTLGPTYTLAAAAADPGGAFGPAIARDADVRQVAARVQAEAGMFPDGFGPYDWALLRAVDAGAADRAAGSIRQFPRRVVEQSISTMLNPASAAEALEMGWLMEVLDRPDDARAAVARVAAMGIPVPAGR